MKSLGNQRLAINVTVGVMLLALCVSVGAQQPKKVPRIGFLTATSSSTNLARTEAFRQGLRELRYVEGKNMSSNGDTAMEK